MIRSICDYLHIYLSRPTVVASDMFLLSMGIAVLVGLLLLKRKVDDLNVTIDILRKKIGE